MQRRIRMGFNDVWNLTLPASTKAGVQADLLGIIVGPLMSIPFALWWWATGLPEKYLADPKPADSMEPAADE